MNGRTRSAARVKELEPAFQCPICGCRVMVIDDKSLICINKHTFDFAKPGYINLSVRPAKGPYTKELFEARRRMITESGLYAPLHERLASMIKEHTKSSAIPCTVADLGCGEGSHLYRILEGCDCPGMTGIGLDLSREGIVLASKRYPETVWIVGDLAQSPFADGAVQVILNILSPANYKEFKRILARDGLVIKVLPRTGYLKELRQSVFMESEKRMYRNDGTAALFQKHFHVLDTARLHYTKELNTGELADLVRMTPLAWSLGNKDIGAFIERESAVITVELDILIGRAPKPFDG
ncbi:methyltransferase domain-containing protein [Paenibacillus sp. 7124]|uniref:Methyltransferase domain-containing protein n=1 Tax=Paenibacillus apii TaxID=1850370 RepID=A0A6M1PTY5_9BACL|nr:methyltransferase domain-containing protein [Paenibacillus apii]NGM83711.1 methyltransferase domain-containing protein [Paenibacillus apii]NJJ41184.1 methyltransferase domain-containing protein [Paenibacillus apii]